MKILGFLSSKTKRSKSGTRARSAQGSIPFIEWYENKIFKVSENTYSLICSFENTGYLSKTDVEQEKKYRSYKDMLCELPNYIHYEEIIYNRAADAKAYINAIAPKAAPYADKYEAAFFDVQRKFVKNVDKDHSFQKYLFAISIVVNGDESPYGKLHESIVMISDKFRAMGSDVKVLSPEEVFEELYFMYMPFAKSMPKIPDNIYKRGLTVKDFIAPDGIAFERDYIKLGESFARVMAITEYGSTVTDRLTYRLSASNIRIAIAKHIDHVDKERAIKQVENQLQSAMGKKNERTSKGGLVPPALERTIEGCIDLLNAFSSGEEYLRQTLYIAVFANSLEELNSNCNRIRAEATSQGTTLRSLIGQSKESFNSVLPLGKEYCILYQNMLASEAAVMTPFSYESYFDEDGFYYGKNYYSDEPIIRNRKKDKSSHGFVFGNTGSGKGIWVKNEISNILYQPSCANDEIVILDPSGEYIPIARAVGGRVVEFSADGNTHINPLLLSQRRIEQEGEREVKASKVRDIVSLLSELKGGGGLDSTEMAVVDRAALNALNKENPTLETLYSEIEAIDNNSSILAWLQRYTQGSVTLFSGEDTTEDSKDIKLTVYDLHKLPVDIRDAVMLVMISKIDDKLRYNKLQGKWTWVYIDEMHRYFDYDRNPLAAQMFSRFYSEARKYGGIFTGITQLPKPVIASRDGSTMLSLSRFVVMSELDDTNIEAIAEKYDLNEEQQHMLYSADIGEYVLRTQNSPMSVRLLYPGAKPEDKNAMYDLFNTAFTGD